MVALLALLASMGCPPEQIVRVDLHRWAARVRAADGTALGPLLAELKLRPPADVVALLQADGRLPHDLSEPALDGRAPSLPACGAQPVRVAGVDVFTAALTGPRARDQVVQVRLEECARDVNGAAVSLRTQVLAPLPGGAFCAVGDDLSTDRLRSDFGCGEHPDRALPRLLAFKSVTSKDIRTIEARDATGVCDGGGESLSFWNVQGASLRRIFEVELDESAWAPHGNERERRVVLELRGGYPKEILVRAREVLSGCHGEDCFSKETSGERRFRLDGTRYVAVPPRRRRAR